MPSDLALRLTLISSNYLCFENIFMVPKVFEPSKFCCITLGHKSVKNVNAVTVRIICTSSESIVYLHKICENIFDSFKAIKGTPFPYYNVINQVMSYWPSYGSSFCCIGPRPKAVSQYSRTRTRDWASTILLD